ncbi:UDP-4-amino-4,6-dideoxy-N-acetyl-beta-L-altrosamine N-acetyltransferase [Helicobacter sp.]|uniref:UDP-4-amino-4, 6-dideoxy-N-acetyl-beta-L-altrosamine N-acetyltransferase n=1 Tax=Helicobacter sp. TaxID=218 RepID=UPI0025BC510C|nr:UDP-4-amino-4,6-dideoxy-N-acetyl-beta-L-altrosamine N-acetyltransferase [Helicobacter sp.]MCI5969333.1 UDP-4-amino-4,6-dideoxy-N-acetyl-beta-L-altrosamine N-acetyltransferase [Helicobacter sp.]MDY2585587.1 UDP-4-amino-4,6-dideoxy-N-acetyl-beta-L-altrosamine N-acetyltransferase [Helicobacter sp.]
MDLDLRTQREILSLRNDARIKSNFYTQHTITLQEHYAFIESLKHNADKQYFSICFCKRVLGSINFYKKGENAEFGFFGNPNLGVSGIGRVLEQISVLYAFRILKVKRLCLEVFKSNKEVINLHKKFDFVSCGEKIVRGKEVLVMCKEE